MSTQKDIAFLKKIADLEAENETLKREQELMARIRENERFLNCIIDNLPIGFQLYNKNGHPHE